jgi:hypothetical protein
MLGKSIILPITLAALLLPATSFSDDSDDYVTAYKACTPVADSSARKQCNYAPAFEDYYLKCMKKYGYNNSDADKFDGYVQAYKYCSAEADSLTKENCNYGSLYRQQYSQCLKQYGFNDAGEKITGGGKETGGAAGDNSEPHFKFDF